MKALKSFGKRRKRITLMLAVTALCASFFPVTSLAGAPAASKAVSDISMNVKDMFKKDTETRSFKDAGLVPGKSESRYTTTIGNISFGEPSIGTNSSMSITVGDTAKVGNDAERSTAIGYNSRVAKGAAHSVALGESSSVAKKDSIAVGKNAKVQTENAVAIGTGAIIREGAVNSVAVGGIYSYDKEGGLGGGVNYMVGANAKSSTVIGAGTMSDSEGATALGQGARVYRNAAGSVALGQESSVGSRDILAGDTHGVVSVGEDISTKGFTRRIINVSDGVNDHDAVNMSQLNSVSSDLQSVSSDLQSVNSGLQSVSSDLKTVSSGLHSVSSGLHAVRSSVHTLGREIDSVGAISSAMAGLHPLDYDGTGSQFQLSAAAGTYDGKQAVALGAFYHPNRDVMVSLGASSTFGGDRKTAGNMGVTFRVGAGSHTYASGQSRDRDMERMRREIEQLKREIAALKAK